MPRLDTATGRIQIGWKRERLPRSEILQRSLFLFLGIRIRIPTTTLATNHEWQAKKREQE